jgi:rhamnosyltransferase
MKVSVIIPTLNPGPALSKLAAMLEQQTLPPTEVIVIDSASEHLNGVPARWKIIPISRETFDHGGTRNRAAKTATGDILIFLSQDVMPADTDWLRQLVSALVDGGASASFARQIPYPNTNLLEVFARGFNYPSESQVKSINDLGRLGIKTFFFSNACSAVLTKAFWSVGGFPEHTIMNEDMALCAKLLRSAHLVKYEATARVFHAHEYNAWQQFQRSFDSGVFVSQFKPLLLGAKTTGEGLRFARLQVSYLWTHGFVTSIPRSILENTLRFAGFTLGQHQRYLPISLKKQLSMHHRYWNKPRTPDTLNL